MFRKISKTPGYKEQASFYFHEQLERTFFFLEGRKCLVFIHKETLYSFVLFDVLKKDLADFQEVFIKHFLKQLHDDYRITEKVKEAVRMDLATIELSTTDGDKSATGYLNDSVDRLTWPRQFHLATIPEIKKYVRLYYNENPSKNHITPKQTMAEKLNIPFSLHDYS